MLLVKLGCALYFIILIISIPVSILFLVFVDIHIRFLWKAGARIVILSICHCNLEFNFVEVAFYLTVVVVPFTN